MHFYKCEYQKTWLYLVTLRGPLLYFVCKVSVLSSQLCEELFVCTFIYFLRFVKLTLADYFSIAGHEMCLLIDMFIGVCW